MEIVHDLTHLPKRLRGAAVSIGNFDGVHRGHARIIGQLKESAATISAPVVVVTFDPHPVRLLRPEQAPPPLTWTKRKARLLGQLDVDALVVYPTDEKVLNMSPTEFFQQIVCERLAARAMAEGPNFFFGHNRTGTIETLGTLCRDNGISLTVVDPLRDGRDYISSSRIRKAIHAGDVATACGMLTEPYRIRGMVTHGAARGSKLGFRTANLDAIDTLIPKVGVYAGRAYIGQSSFAAAVNVGPNPTFGDQENKVEVHILDFDENVYGEPLEVSFLTRLRDTQRFSDIEQLKQQLDQDIQDTRRVCGQ